MGSREAPHFLFALRCRWYALDRVAIADRMSGVSHFGANNHEKRFRSRLSIACYVFY
jgi:hypothetical protein